MVSVRGAVAFSLMSLLQQAVNGPFCFITEAIYLAKRNIRKKGILELHEQVRMTLRATMGSGFVGFGLLRWYLMTSGAVQPSSQVDES